MSARDINPISELGRAFGVYQGRASYGRREKGRLTVCNTVVKNANFVVMSQVGGSRAADVSSMGCNKRNTDQGKGVSEGGHYLKLCIEL